MKRVCIFIISLLILSSPLLASVPHQINYQGILTDDVGSPLHGSYDLTFSIYADSLTATPVWTEAHTDVIVDRGLFSLLLGSSNPIWESLFLGTERWLGVTVAADPELSPRMRMTSVPWALRAAVADSVGGVDWSNVANIPAGFADGVDDVGGAGDDHSLDAADGSQVDVVYVDNGGQVGIGTTSPTDQFEVIVPSGSSGGLSISHATSYNGYPTLSFNVAGSKVASLSSHQTGVHLYMQTQPGKGNLIFRPGGIDLMMATPSGVGIGTGSPTEMLDVVGTVKATAFIGDGAQITGITEADPTVPASIKDGIDWTEVSAIPAGFADGIDDIGPADGNSLDAIDGSPTNVVRVDANGHVAVGYPSAQIPVTVTDDYLNVMVHNAGGGLTIQQAVYNTGGPGITFKSVSSAPSSSKENVASMSIHQGGVHLYVDTKPGKGNLYFRPEGVQTVTMLPGRVNVSDVMRLEPRSSAPSSPSEGDMYMDGTTHKLMVFDGTIWQACF